MRALWDTIIICPEPMHVLRQALKGAPGGFERWREREDHGVAASTRGLPQGLAPCQEAPVVGGCQKDAPVVGLGLQGGDREGGIAIGDRGEGEGGGGAHSLKGLRRGKGGDVSTYAAQVGPGLLSMAWKMDTAVSASEQSMYFMLMELPLPLHPIPTCAHTRICAYTHILLPCPRNQP
jgi:hypothetical protein